MQQDTGNTIPPAGDRNGNVLCCADGLCCRGIWFSHVELDESEVEPARRLGTVCESVY